MKAETWICVLVIITVILIFVWGCQNPEKPEDTATRLNLTTAQGRVADLVEKSSNTFNLLILIMVGGIVFWGATKTSWGWIIPAACISGMACIHTFAKYSEWIGLGVLGIAGLTIILKAKEYQKERNANKETK